MITEVGPKVKSVKVGDRVIAITQTGAFAEQVVVHEAAVLKLPPTVDLTAAAGGSLLCPDSLCQCIFIVQVFLFWVEYVSASVTSGISDTGATGRRSVAQKQ